MANDKELKPVFETCAICFGLLVEARDLSCRHCFCATCIRNILHSPASDVILCPICHKETTVVDGNIENLQLHHETQALEDKARKEETEPACHQCWQRVTSYNCTTCCECLCEKCSEAHSLCALQQQNKNPATEQSHQPVCQWHCVRHELPLRYFCLFCGHPICQDCKLLHHLLHETVLLSEHFEGQRGNMKQQTILLQQQVTAVELRMQELRAERDTARVRIEQYLDEWKKSKSRLLTLIEKRDEAVCQEARRVGEEVTANYAHLIDQLQQQQALASKYLEKAKRVFETTNQVEALACLKQLFSFNYEDPKQIQLSEVDFLLPSNVCWWDLLVTSPEHAQLLPGQQVVLVRHDWVQRIRQGVLRANLSRGDPLALRLVAEHDPKDSDSRKQYMCMDRSLAGLLRFLPYPSKQEQKPCEFPTNKLIAVSKSVFPIHRPVQFLFRVQQQGSDLPQRQPTYGLVADLNSSVRGAFYPHMGVLVQCVRTESGQVLELERSLKSYVCEEGLKEFSLLVVTVAIR